MYCMYCIVFLIVLFNYSTNVPLFNIKTPPPYYNGIYNTWKKKEKKYIKSYNIQTRTTPRSFTVSSITYYTPYCILTYTVYTNKNKTYIQNGKLLIICIYASPSHS